MEPTTVYRSLTASEFINEIGGWAGGQFPTRRPFTSLLGIVEEIGEAAHCVLKHDQKIRGYADKKYFLTELSDCFADAAIYLADFVHQRGAFFTFKRNDVQYNRPDDEQRIVTHLLIALTALMSFDNQQVEDSPAVLQNYNILCQKVLTMLEIWADFHHIDVQSVAVATWCRNVSKRDWKTNPTNAHEKAED